MEASFNTLLEMQEMPKEIGRAMSLSFQYSIRDAMTEIIAPSLAQVDTFNTLLEMQRPGRQIDDQNQYSGGFQYSIRDAPLNVFACMGMRLSGDFQYSIRDAKISIQFPPQGSDKLFTFQYSIRDAYLASTRRYVV